MAQTPIVEDVTDLFTGIGFGAELFPGEIPSLRITYDGSPIWDLPVTFTWNGQDLAVTSDLVSVSEQRVTEEFAMLVGKAAGHHHAEHIEITHEFCHTSQGTWGLILRIAADGVALRFRTPPMPGDLGAAGPHIELGAEDRLWFQDYQTWYENPLHGSGAQHVTEERLGLPVLIAHGDRHLLVTESDLDGSSSGSHLRATHVGDALRLEFQPADPSLPVQSGYLTPWRVILGGTLAAVVSSNLVDELATPATVPVPAWVRPGPAVWSWWSDHYSGSQPEAQRRFIDFAAELGWRHVLIDCGWVEDWVPEIVSYASRVGVLVHLWCRWSELETPEQRRQLRRWAAWGVAGVKVDFMESESNERYRWYQATLEDAWEAGLMVNLHGSVIPRGWARRWPHVISYEAIRANEYYSFYNEPIPTSHHVIAPFTRNVLGSMDFTPAAINTAMRATTEAAEAATLVLFECGITHLADDPDAYRQRPALMQLLRCLPDQWDATVLLDGHPDSHVVLARRSGEVWFVAGMITGPARQVRVPLTGLGTTRTLWLLSDDDAGLRAGQVDLGGDVLDLHIPADGGFVAVLGGLPLGRHPVETALPDVHETDLHWDTDGSALLRVEPGCSVTTEPGWAAIQVEHDTWRISRDSETTQLATVVTLHSASGGVCHVRLHAPLTAETSLSALPFTAMVNHFGPVERDQSNGGGNPADGGPLTVAGQRFSRGLGTSSPSRVEFFLGGEAGSFIAQVGIDDETPGAIATVHVLVDGQPRCSLPIRGGSPAQLVSVDVTGAMSLALASEPTDATVPTHVDWANALVTPVTSAGGTDARPVNQEGMP